MSEFVKNHYRQHVDSEWRRLDEPLGRIEFMSTMRLIGKYFPKTGRIADIGSGPGRYAIELTKLGYLVTLYDLAQELLDRAQTAFEEHNLKAEQFICGDARKMGVLESESYDATLLLGPLYHIIDKSGREDALHELKRILKPRGIGIVAYLNSWG